MSEDSLCLVYCKIKEAEIEVLLALAAEQDHKKADEAIQRFLTALGYENVVGEYQRVPKLYDKLPYHVPIKTHF